MILDSHRRVPISLWDICQHNLDLHLSLKSINLWTQKVIPCWFEIWLVFTSCQDTTATLLTMPRQMQTASIQIPPYSSFLVTLKRITRYKYRYWQHVLKCMNALTRNQFLYLYCVRLNHGSVYPGTNDSEEYATVIVRVEVTSCNLTICQSVSCNVITSEFCWVQFSNLQP